MKFPLQIDYKEMENKHQVIAKNLLQIIREET